MMEVKVLFDKNSRNDSLHTGWGLSFMIDGRVLVDTGEDGVKPLSKKKMSEIEKHFEGLNVISVYKSVRKKVIPVSEEDTLKRRGKVLMDGGEI